MFPSFSMSINRLIRRLSGDSGTPSDVWLMEDGVGVWLMEDGSSFFELES